MRVYRSPLGPVVTDADATVCLTKRDRNMILMFERKIIRKIVTELN